MTYLIYTFFCKLSTQKCLLGTAQDMFYFCITSFFYQENISSTVTLGLGGVLAKVLGKN